VQNVTSLTITALRDMTPCNFVDDVHYQQRKGKLTALLFCLFFAVVKLRLATSENKIDCRVRGVYLYLRERERERRGDDGVRTLCNEFFMLYPCQVLASNNE
jgi:hypothetical protein